MRMSHLFEALNPFAPIRPVAAHCDLFCGVYYPEQARIEAESVKNCSVKYHESDDEVFRQRAIQIKEERAELVKHHLWVLWTDYFKPPHLEEYPELHDLFWRATKAAGDAKKSVDVEDGQKLIDLIDEISVIFYKTKGGKPDWLTS
jgi:nickel superoxide dismutase